MTLNDWHRVQISRSDRTGSLQVNDEVPVSGQSAGRSGGLNLKTGLFIGGYTGTYDSSSGVTQSFSGAIQRVSLLIASFRS